MNFEAVKPFLLILSPFLIAFLIEAAVVYFFKLRKFATAFGISVIVNIISLSIISFALVPLLGKLGYEFNGLELPPQVIFFLCWLSILVEGFLLHLFIPKQDPKRIFTCAALMNVLSYLFLYAFIELSH